MYYTFGAVGISVLSVWLLRDSRLSDIINNWILETKDSTVRFLSDNVEQPLTLMRDGLFETYMNCNKGVIEYKRLQGNSDLLHRLLLDFGKRTGLKFPPNASDQEMYNMVKNRPVTRRTKRKERIAQAQRTRLLLNVEKYVNSSSQKKEDPDYVTGLLLYSLNRLYRAVKKRSKALGRRSQWSILVISLISRPFI